MAVFIHFFSTVTKLAGIFSAEEKERLIQDVKGLNIKLAEQEVQIRESEDELFELALQLPNR